MICPLMMAGVMASDNPLEKQQQGYGYCEETGCAWWVGSGGPGIAPCAIAHLGYQAALKFYEKEGAGQ
jgi:hypothetical protein